MAVQALVGRVNGHQQKTGKNSKLAGFGPLFTF
jgi:hypothetical protein